MKKFLVGLLSVLVLFGATLLSACEKNKIDITLSQQSVSLELHGADETQSTATVNATITGGDDVRITASVLGGYENSIVSVSTKYVSSKRTDIVLTGLSEGEAEVTVRTNQGNVVKYIYVTVFSSVSSMEQREEPGDKTNYLVRGQTNFLNENNLISFYPNDKSRRDITWSLAETKEGLTLEGANLTISDDFKGEVDKTLNLETIKLIATTEKGVKTEIVLPVLNKIDENIELQYSNSKSSGFNNVTEENNVFDIVPNIPTDNNYRGYFLVNYLGDLEIKAHVYDANGEETDDLIINRDNFVGGLPCFVIFANSKKVNINGNYKISFTIGYQGYTYRVDSADYVPITIKARERVNKIEVSTNEVGSVAGSVQTLYTTYAESRETSVYGQKYYITISPSTVIDATGKYKISLKWLEAGGIVADGCPVEVWFQDITEANRWRKVEFKTTDDGYEANEEFLINVKTLYIKAANTLTEQSLERLSMTFTSVDNTDISTTFNLRLVRSVSLGDFTFENANIKIDSSENDGNVVVKKEFTIQGQTDIDGLYIINNSNAVIFENIRKVSNTRDSVTFEITVNLKPSSYGLTRVDTYQIAHRNGLVTNPYNIEIFQPLKWASIHLNSAENESNSVVDYDVSRNTYSTQGSLIASDDNDSVSKLMLHNATTTPLLYYFNSVNGINAQAEINVEFYDYNEEEWDNVEQFKALMNNDVGCIAIVNQARNNKNYSKVASFSADFTSIVTKAPGFTYAVVTFSGKGIDSVDDNGNYTFVKIIQIQSFVAPMGLEIRPSSNKSISLYSLDSLATSDEALTKQDISVRFSQNDITYRQTSNVEFVSSMMGNRVVSQDPTVAVWRSGYYSLSNIAVTGDGISFTILANSTFTENIFRDTLEVHYIVSDNGREVYEIFTTIDIVIRNAQRIESLAWENYDKDGLYFEVGDVNPKYMILSTAPANAKNNTIAYVITDESGNVTSTFLSISDAISSSTLSVNLSGTINRGMTGYAYILPADAVYNGKIKYYVDGISGEVDLNYLGLKMSPEMTYYEYLVNSGAYFISNATDSIEKQVAFSEILLRVKITVADGRSFDYAYRIYDSQAFMGMRENYANVVTKFYTIMNSLDLPAEFVSFGDITGGIQGYNSDVTIRFNGQNLALNNSGEIRNLTFNGYVNANGFIVVTNSSLIKNVTIDVNGRSSSKLSSITSEGSFVGGIASINMGTIDGASVLGLTITQSNPDEDGGIVGGIAGKNEKDILNSRVEFYNLEEGSEADGFTYTANYFKGNTVGAIVGQIGVNSKIDHTFAYDYTLTAENNENHVIQGINVGAFAGNYEGENTDEPTAKINYSFVVVGVREAYGRRGSEYNNSDPKKTVLLTNYYVGYYERTVYTLTDDETNDEGLPNSNFISSGAGFLNYVNNGKYHLKDLYQEEKVEEINYNVDKYEENGYYKSLPVDENNGILFFYKLNDNFVDLNSAQTNELNRFNTISLEQLIGASVSKNVIITSSKVNIVRVIGSTLQVLNVGDVDIVLSSKMDVQNCKTIHIKIVYALSEVLLSWTGRGGNTAYVADDSIVSIQETKSRDYFVSYLRPQVYLGVSANGYTLKQNTISLKIDRTVDLEEDKEKIVDCEVSGGNTFKVNVKSNDARTNFVVSPKIFEEENYQNSIDEEFERKFVINPTKGVITFSLTGNSLPITPSINSSIQVEIRTTAENDRIVPVIMLNGEKLVSTNEEKESLYHYHLAGLDQDIIDVLVTLVDQDADAESGMFTYVYDVNFSVSPTYRSRVSEDMEFDGYFLSTSENSSLDEDDTFKITLTKQKFTNIDMANKIVASSTYETSKNSTVNLVYKGGELSTILAPGNNSILEVSVNPEFAYYDHVSLSYSGTTVSNAVSLTVLSLTDAHGNIVSEGEDDDYYIERARRIDGDIDSSKANMITFTPTAEEKLLGKLFFKVWINTSVNRDTIIKFTATFYDSNNNILSFANYYLTVSYLNEAKITIDGSSTAYLAKGSSADIRIDVMLDQIVDSLVLDGESLQGISMSGLGEPEVDEVKGIKTYRSKIYANLFAAAKNNKLSVQATVSRKLGNSVQNETKTTVATVVIVDFKVDADNITIDGRSDGILNIWQGVPKPINIGYNLVPESYVNPGDDDSEKAIANIMKQRNIFLQNGYYPLKQDLKDKDYYINYKYNKGELEQEPFKLLDRLFFVQGNQRTPITENIANKPFEVILSTDENGNQSISFKGIRANMSVECVLETYVSAGGYTSVYDTFFTVYVETYSDPDVPLLISNATDFKNLAPVDGQEIKANDYILTNDIVLENYVPFDTSLIRSFDGNGHTIFIRSFNIDPDATILNLALFNNIVEGTLIKNVRINVFDGGDLTINVQKLTEFNFAGMAINNEGIITNSEVVSFYTADSAYGDDKERPIGACSKDKERSGIMIKFVKGSADYKLQGNAMISNIAGFVGTNGGSITNSRVGGNTITILGEERKVAGEPTGFTYASYLDLDTFYMVGQGNMAGFVNTNANGNISACYVKNIDMLNNALATSLYTSGFVGTNSSVISVSYVEGAPSSTDNSLYAYEGTSLKSEMGYIVGFVYSNTSTGRINDAYTNILIANDISDTKVYLASGFVYENEGIVENGYSASQILNSKYTQMNFSGVDEKGDLRATGTYINCYFFNWRYEDTEDFSRDESQESLYKTGVSLITSPTNSALFYGFAVADGEGDGVWKINDDGVTLIDANIEIISNRYVLYVPEDYNGGVTGNSEDGKYILPYSTLNYTNAVRTVDTTLGSTYNPIIIANALDFVSATGQSLSTSVQQYYNETSIWGTYRLVDNIDLSTLLSSDSAMSLPSSTRSFSGTLYGNSFTISGISITSQEKGVAFGLFSSIEKRGKNANPIIKNLNLEISQVVAGETSMVGGLAGYAINSVLVSIDITFTGTTGVNGLNFVGGLVGLASGNNIIKNINITDPTIVAEKYVNEGNTQHYFITDEQRGEGSLQKFRNNISNSLNYNTLPTSDFIKSIENYSYAGSVVGFVDNYASDVVMFDVYQAGIYSINSIRVNGVVNVEGQVVGGAFGLTSYQTNIRDVGVTVSRGSKILATKYFAGGVIGQSFSSVDRIFAVHEETIQNDIEDNMANFYAGNEGVERGILDLFYLPNSEYRQIYVGGLIGYAGSGNLEISYSRLNVTAPSADFAGGIIGGLEVEGVGLYQTHTLNDNSRESASVNYFLNEVYATGDVRADSQAESINAGGIIGRAVGKVAFLSVNALNYITTYNYLNNQYDPVPTSLTNLSNYIKVNSLVGQFAKRNLETNQIEEDEKVEFNNYKEHLNLLRYVSSSTSGSINTSDLPSVAYYEGYYKAQNVLYTLNVFARIDGSIKGENKLFYGDTGALPVVNVINSPSDFSDSATGHSYTQSGFISSGVWSPDNWDHEIVDLVPTIKFKQSLNVLYLDQFNVKEVFQQMSNSNATVIVRGRTGEDSETFGNVDVRQVVESGVKITNFSGKLIRGKEYTDANHNPIKIIAAGNFIDSVGSGFTTSDLIIDYEGEVNGKLGGVDSILERATGLFINGTVADASISSLTMNIDSPIFFFPRGGGDNASTNIGLIAGSLISTSVRGVYINFVGSNGAAMNLINIGDQEDEKFNFSNLNIGLIAGLAKQTSTITIMSIENININFDGSFFNIQKSFNTLSVGGYVGIAQRTVDAQPFNMVLSEMKLSTNDGQRKLSVSGEAQKNKAEKSNYFIGGYIGVVGKIPYAGTSANTETGITGIDSINTKESAKLDIKIDFILKNNYGVLYVGGVTAYADVNAFVFNANNSALNIRLKFAKDSSVSTLYAGGLDGYLTGGAMSVSNIAEIKFEVFNDDGNESAHKIDKNKFNSIDNNKTNAISVKNAYTGGIVGYANSAFSYSCDTTTLINALTENQALEQRDMYYPSVRFKVDGAGSVNAGSILGYTQALASSNSLRITGAIISTMEFLVEGSSGTANIGGMVGNIYGQVGKTTSDSTSTVYSKSVFGEQNVNQDIIAFNGAVYSNIKNLMFGGVVGRYSGSIGGNSLEVYRTSFGGVVKVYGANSNNANITTGGVIGNATVPNNTFDITLKEIYNYGDVYVEYDNSLQNLTTYNFGGITGNIGNQDSGTGKVEYKIEKVYTIMTSFNTKYQSTSKSANALFGGTDSAINGETKFYSMAYYNHAVVLLTDERGIDISYNNNKGELGYKSQWTITSGNNIKDAIVNALNGYLTFEQGHKLNPYALAAVDNNYKIIKTDNNFNGRTYYLVGDETFNQRIENANTGTETTSELKNVAIFGDRSNVEFTNNLTTHFGVNTHGLFDSMKGYSSISGFAIDANITYDNIGTGDYGILVGSMNEQSIVYAINVRGSLDVGGTGAANISGLVGKLNNGHIYDVSTDLDIRYRAGANGNIYGLTHLNTGSYKRIEDSYTGGSIQTLISANVTAFANVDGDKSIANCYAYPKLDLRDYTKESDNERTGTVSVFGNSEGSVNLRFDSDGLNYENISEAAIKTPLSSLQGQKEDSDSYFAKDRWTYNYDFNYGYPTLRYQYLNPSSYAMITETKKKAETLDGKTLQISSSITREGDEGKESYDNYVYENTYERLGNGIKPYTEEPANKYYFMIPNVSLLLKMNYVHNSGTEESPNYDGLTKNFILKYDIDLYQTGVNSTQSDYFNVISSDREFKGIFDGQNKTIKNLGKKATKDTTGHESLFTNIIGADENNIVKVMNLRLTDVYSTRDSALAKEKIEYAEISNIVLSGEYNITSNDEKDKDNKETDKVVGALTPIARCSKLYAIKNMIQVDVKASDSQVVDYYPGADPDIHLFVNGAVAGGIVGKIQDTEMKYCSNYGPINVATGNNSKVLMAGGLVGIALLGNTGNTIAYSYNSTSVLCDYASTTGKNESTGIFFAGGLVGYIQATNNRKSNYSSSTTIKYSYNSGMIKAGNKSNTGQISNILNREDENRNSYNCAAYAGGITSYIEGGNPVSLTYCYNEGAVEALGENPKTGWYFENDKFVLKQLSNRNVYAYGLAYLQAKNAEIADTCKVVANANDQIALYDTIYNNGSALENGTIINDTIAWKDVKAVTGNEREKPIGTDNDVPKFSDLPVLESDFDEKIKDVSGLYQSIKIETKEWDHIVNTIVYFIPVIPFIVAIPLYICHTENHDSRILVGREIQKLNTSDELSEYTYSGIQGENAKKGIYNMQKSSLDLPTKVVIPIQNKIFFDLAYISWLVNYKDSLDSYTYFDYYQTTQQLENIDKDYMNLATSNKKYVAYQCKEDKEMGSESLLQSPDSTNIKDLKLYTRSIETLDDEMGSNEDGTTFINSSHELSINGKTYYLADGDNFNAVFNAGTYIASSSVTFNDLPYVPNTKYYSITVKDKSSNPQTYSASVTGVTNDGKGNTTISFKVFSKEPINGDFDVSIDLDYSETVQLDLSKLKYYYVDDYSVGLRLPIRGYKLRGYTLTSQANPEISYTNLIKVSKKQYECLENGRYLYEPSDEAENQFIYLAFKNVLGSGENDFIYIPNAVLTIPGAAETKQVNIDENFIVSRGGGINEFLPINPYKEEEPSDEGEETFAANVQKVIEGLLKGCEFDEPEAGNKIYYLYERKHSGAMVTRSLSDYMTQLYHASDTLSSELNIDYNKELQFGDVLGDITVDNENKKLYRSSKLSWTAGENLVAVDGKNVIFAIDFNGNVKINQNVQINRQNVTLSADGNRLLISYPLEGGLNNIKNYFENLKYYASPKDATKDKYQKVKEYLTETDEDIVNINGEEITYQKKLYLGDKENYKAYMYAGIKINNVNETVEKYTLDGVTVYHGRDKITWDNYFQYNADGNISIGLIKSDSSMLVNDEIETKERIDFVYSPSVEYNGKKVEGLNRGVTQNSSGSVTFSAKISETNPKIQSLIMTLNAYPTYRLGAVSKEESYAYKFLIKDANGIYQVALNEIEDLPENNITEGDKPLLLNEDNIESITRYYIDNGQITHYLKAEYTRTYQSNEYDEGYRIMVNYYVNFMNEGEADQMIYSFILADSGDELIPYSATIYFDENGPIKTTAKCQKVRYVKKNGKEEVGDYWVAATGGTSGPPLTDSAGFLVFENDGFNGKYRMDDNPDNLLTLTSDEGAEIRVQTRVVDENGEYVGDLMIKSSNIKVPGSDEGKETYYGTYYVQFNDGRQENVKTGGGSRDFMLKASPTIDLAKESKKDVFNNKWVMYGPGGLTFKADTEREDYNLYLADLNLTKFDGIFKIARQSYSEVAAYYIYLDSTEYTMVKQIKQGDNQSLDSEVRIPKFTYDKFEVPIYKQEPINFSLNVSLERAKGELVLYQNTSDTSKSSARIVQNEEGLWNVFLKGYGSEYKAFATAQINRQITRTIKKDDENKIIALSTPAARDIIITKDISFSNLAFDKTITKDENINIIGNNYFISYFDTSLFTDLQSNSKSDTWIREVNFLGENNESVNGKSLLLTSTADVAANAYNVKIVDSKIYGSFINNTIDKDGAKPVFTQQKARRNIEFVNFESYVSINTLKILTTARNDKNTMALFGTYGKLDTVKNKGVIDLEDGEHGENGADGSGSKAERQGKNGANGMSLKFSSKQPSGHNALTNSGIIKLGLGGNGGAGGSTPNDVADTNDLPEQATRGKKGDPGKIDGYTNEGGQAFSIGTQQDSMSGAVGRLALNDSYHRLAQEIKNTAVVSEQWLDLIIPCGYQLQQPPQISYQPLKNPALDLANQTEKYRDSYDTTTNTVTAKTNILLSDQLNDNRYPGESFDIINRILGNIYNLAGHESDFIPPS